MCSCCDNASQNGLLVKRLRRRPLTAETGVRFPHGSPRRSKVRFAPTYFFCQKISLPPASLLLLFRKRSRCTPAVRLQARSQRLRLLSTFCDWAPSARILCKVRFAPTYFFCQKISLPPASLLLLFRKRSRCTTAVRLQAHSQRLRLLSTFCDRAPSTRVFPCLRLSATEMISPFAASEMKQKAAYLKDPLRLPESLTFPYILNRPARERVGRFSVRQACRIKGAYFTGSIHVFCEVTISMPSGP